MNKAKWQRLVAAPLVALMLVASFAPVAMAAGQAAMVAQTQGPEVSGTIPGGQFAKIWLGLKPINPGTVTVRAEWDRESARGQGIGFYILDESNLASAINGEPLQDNNIAAGDPTFYLNGPTNVQGAAFRATGPDYTVVVYNDSAADANFKLTAENGILKDDSGQVKAPAGEATPEAAATDTAAPAVAASDVTTTTNVVTTTTTAAPAPVATVAAVAPAAVVATTGGAVSAQEMKGELPNQFDQHFLALKPSIRDGVISVVMTYDPQDSTELARRINFWVLDQNGFTRYQEGESAADLAIAAGSKFFLDPDTSNKREASFNAAGFGPYTVIVQNNSRVPATYDLSVTGGILTDDSNQTLTAQQAGGITTTTTVSGTTTTAPAATTTTTTTTTAATTTSGVAGQPGGTYTVKSGDTLAIIARDIYGDYRLYEQLCAFNSIADCNAIEVGQVVKLPTQAQIGAVATTAPAAAATPAATTAATPAVVAKPAASAPTTTTATSGVTTTVPVTSTGTTTTTSSVSSTTTTTKTTTTAPATSKSIVDVAAGAGNFTILVDALKQTGIDTDLAGAGPFTVFAPTDAAFNALLSGNGLTEAQLLQAKELADILRYHVLSGKVLAADVTNGLKATTLQGKPVSFEVKDGKVFINGAQIVTTDIPAANGVIHAIDAVILPPNN